MSEGLRSAGESSESSRGRILTDTAKISTTRVYSIVLAVIQGFVVARVLGPEMYGLLSLILLIAFYANLIGPGLLDVANRELPFLAGKGDTQGAHRLRSVGFSGDLLWRAFLCVCVLVAAIFQSNEILRYGLIITAITLFTARLNEIYSVVCQVKNDFHLLSKATFLTSTLTSGLIIATVYWGKVFSPLLVPLVVSLVIIFYYQRHTRLEMEFSVDRTELKRMIRIGIPLQLLTVVVWIYRSSDRTMVASLLDTTSLGYYALAVNIVQYLQLPQNDFVLVLRPRLYELLGRSEDPAELRAYIVKPTLIIAYLVPFVIGLVWLCSPVIVMALLPKYAGSISVLKILALDVYFATILLMPHILLYSAKVNRQTHCVYVWGGATVVTVILSYVFLRMSWGIEGVAVAMVLGQALAAAFIFGMSHKYYLKGVRGAFMHYVKVVLPIAYTAVIVLLIGCVSGHNALTIQRTGVQTIVFALFFLPVLFFLNVETRALSLARDWTEIRLKKILAAVGGGSAR
jgi:O-antigen/teichoic acid export membrane protein